MYVDFPMQEEEDPTVRCPTRTTFGCDQFGYDRFGCDWFVYDRFGYDWFGCDRFGYAIQNCRYLLSLRKSKIQQKLIFYALGRRINRLKLINYR